MIDIKELSESDLKQKIENIKAEREKTENALKRYEVELERRKQEAPLGVPTNVSGEGLFCVSSVNTTLAVKENFSIIAVLFDVLNLFPSQKSAQKHAEMLLAWRKALVANAKGEPIDIKVLLPLLPKGWVAMDKNGSWHWYKEKPYIENYCSWNSGSPISFIGGFNIKPAEGWCESLMECGL